MNIRSIPGDNQEVFLDCPPKTSPKFNWFGSLEVVGWNGVKWFVVRLAIYVLVTLAFLEKLDQHFGP